MQPLFQITSYSIAILATDPPYLLDLMVGFISRRRLILRHPQHLVVVEPDGGVPQDSTLGPILWNLVLDGLLSTIQAERYSFTAYADDLNVAFAADSRLALENSGNDALALLRACTLSKPLQLSQDKTREIGRASCRERV